MFAVRWPDHAMTVCGSGAGDEHLSRRREHECRHPQHDDERHPHAVWFSREAAGDLNLRRLHVEQRNLDRDEAAMQLGPRESTHGILPLANSAYVMLPPIRPTPVDT